MKILKSRKALSPVVASIILIAVTVAVSLAVAVWMGSLTSGQMQTEQLNIIDVRLDKTTKKVYVEVANTGGTTVTITDIRIDEVSYVSFNGTTGACSPTLPYDLPKGNTVTFTLTFNNNNAWPFRSGVLYYFKVVTAKGNQFGPVQRYGPA